MQNEELKENHTEQTEEVETVEATETQEDLVEQNNQTSDDSDIANLSKSDAVVALVNKAKELVEDADNKLNESLTTLKNDLQEYEESKTQLKETVIEVNSELKQQIDYQQEHLEELEAQEDGTQFGDELEALQTVEDSIEVLKEEDFVEAQPYKVPSSSSHMYVQEPSSGKFGGFIMGLIGGGATLAGMAYFASTKLGIKLDPTKAPSMETCKPIFDFYAKLVNQNNTEVGMGLMGGTALLVLWLIYTIKKSSKSSKNIEFAKEQLKQAEAYALQKVEDITSIDKLDSHIKEATETFKLYDIILKEQKAKLNRIMYIESDKIASGDLHEKSLQEIDDTRSLIESFKSYIVTPLVNESEKLSDDIVNALSNMKSALDKLLSRLY
jgi:hypothetical protein